MLGPRGVAFDNDDVLDIEEDEDLKDDPIWKMDMQASFSSCGCHAADTNTETLSGPSHRIFPRMPVKKHWKLCSRGWPTFG